MASMYKRNGVWYGKWYQNGKIKRKSLKTKSVQRARAKLVEIEESLADGRPVEHVKDIAVDDFTVKYLESIKTTKRPHTIKTLSHEWRAFVDWAKPMRLGDVAPETIAQYKAFKLEKGYAKSTVRSTLLALSSVFGTAIKDMHCLSEPNPVKGVGLPKPDQGFPQYLELEEIDTVLKVAEEHSRNMHLLFAIGLFCGLRKNELINAKWDWIDFKGTGRVLVKSSGRFRTKSGKDRKVPMSNRLRSILERYRVDRPAEFIVYPEQPEKDGTDTKYRVDFTDAFGRICKAADVAWVTPHKLRHTFASQLAIAGVSIYKISNWMGHADVKTTMIYAHLSPDDDDINAF